MNVIVNDEQHRLEDGTTVGQLISRLALTPRRVAVERNRELVPRATYDRTVLKDGDQIEIVTLVGGG